MRRFIFFTAKNPTPRTFLPKKLKYRSLAESNRSLPNFATKNRNLYYAIATVRTRNTIVRNNRPCFSKTENTYPPKSVKTILVRSDFHYLSIFTACPLCMIVCLAGENMLATSRDVSWIGKHRPKILICANKFIGGITENGKEHKNK